MIIVFLQSLQCKGLKEGPQIFLQDLSLKTMSDGQNVIDAEWMARSAMVYTGYSLASKDV
jgi:hypothetical protein